MSNKKDFATSTVLTAPSTPTAGTSLVVQSGHGARFPAAPFYVVAHPPSEFPTLDNAEKLLVSAKSTDTFTITRAQGDTTAKTIEPGWRISNAVFLADFPATFDDLTDGTTNKGYTSTEKTKLAGIASGADVTSATNVGSSMSGASAKTTPVDADTLPLNDSAASNALKKVTWANIKATLKTYFDTLYQPLDATLTALAGLATGANKIPYSTGTDAFGQLTLDTDVTLAANSDTTLASQKANKAYVDTLAKNKQADTTNGTWVRPLIQTGIGRVVSGGGAGYQQEFVTFPTPFKTGTIPTVLANSIGYRPAGSSYDPSAIADLTWSKFSASAVKPTATGFNAYITRFDGTGMSDDYFYSWIAVGETP